MQKVWLEMKGLTLLTLSEMSDPTFLTLGSVCPFTFVSPWPDKQDVVILVVFLVTLEL